MKNEFGIEIEDSNEFHVVNKKLFYLKNLPRNGRNKINSIHIEVLCKIYSWMKGKNSVNQHGACRKPNVYFQEYFQLSKSEIQKILKTLESYGLIVRYEKKLKWDETKERYMWVNCKLINRILMDKVFDEIAIPSWAIENAIENGWSEVKGEENE